MNGRRRAIMGGGFEVQSDAVGRVEEKGRLILSP